MIGNMDVSVFLPADCFETFEALCTELGWSHGTLLTALIENAPPAAGQKEPPPPKTKRSDCTRRLTATLDSYRYKRMNVICELWGWSHRDLVINLLDHYITIQRQKEIHNG